MIYGDQSILQSKAKTGLNIVLPIRACYEGSAADYGALKSAKLVPQERGLGGVTLKFQRSGDLSFFFRGYADRGGVKQMRAERHRYFNDK